MLVSISKQSWTSLTTTNSKTSLIYWCWLFTLIDITRNTLSLMRRMWTFQLWGIQCTNIVKNHKKDSSNTQFLLSCSHGLLKVKKAMLSLIRNSRTRAKTTSEESGKKLTNWKTRPNNGLENQATKMI